MSEPEQLHFTPEQLKGMTDHILSHSWIYKYTYRTMKSPSFVSFTADDNASEIERMRSEQKLRMAAEAARLDARRVTGRWHNILRNMLMGWREVSLANGHSVLLDEHGNEVKNQPA